MSPNIIMPAIAGLASAGLEFPKIKETPLAMHEKNFKWRNQRQLRKNRRRANAAGAKGAFARAVSTPFRLHRSRYMSHIGVKQFAKITAALA